jgi:hypothetical protein
MTSKGWRFNLGKIQKYKTLPEPINLKDSSSDDDIPQVPTRKLRFPPIRVVQQSAQPSPAEHSAVSELSNDSRLNLSAHSQLMSQNFSTYSPTKQPQFGKTTMESLQLESQTLALQTALSRCSDLESQKAELDAEFRRLKLENGRKLSDFRERLETTAEKLEKNAGVLRMELLEQTKKLNEVRARREIDPRFVDIRRKQEYIAETKRSFAECQESIAALANILQYSPLAESEFDVITNTGSFDSPVGRAVLSFIEAAKRMLVKKQNEI